MATKSNQPIILEYEDGEQVTAYPKMRHLVAAEEKFGKNRNGTPPIQGTLYAAWLALDKPGSSYQSWLRTVDGIIVDAEDEPGSDSEDDRPTKAAVPRSVED